MKKPVIYTAVIATQKSREHYLFCMLRTVHWQFDRLVVYLNDHEEIPSWLHEEFPNVEPILGRLDMGDLGSRAKFRFAADTREFYFSLDDDILYPMDYSIKMNEAVERHGRRAIICAHGNVFTSNNVLKYASREYKNVIGLSDAVTADMPVHLGGSGTLCWHASTIPLSLDIFKIRNHDDVQLGAYCQRQSIPIITVARPARWLVTMAVRDSIWDDMKRDDSKAVEIIQNHQPWKFVTLPVDPLVVTFYADVSDSTYYLDKATAIQSDCARLGLDCIVVRRDYLGNKADTCKQKPRVILEALKEQRGPVLWIDADGKIARKPDIFRLLHEGKYDFAAPIQQAPVPPNPEFMAALMWFNYTEATLQFVTDYMTAVESNPIQTEHRTLMEVWNKWRGRLRFYSLPAEYCFMARHKLEPYCLYSKSAETGFGEAQTIAITVAANAHRKPLITDALDAARLEYQLNITPDFNLPDDFNPTQLRYKYRRDDPKWNLGAYRCWRAHQLAIEKALDNLTHEKAILVLEDDAVPNRTDWIRLITQSVELLEQFDIVSLHGRKLSVGQTFVAHGQSFVTLVNDKGCEGFKRHWGALAYLLKPETARRLAEMPFTLHIDLTIANDFNTCVLTPSCFNHADTADSSERKTNSIFELVSGQSRNSQSRNNMHPENCLCRGCKKRRLTARRARQFNPIQQERPLP